MQYRLDRDKHIYIMVLWWFFTHHSVVACKIFVEAKKQIQTQKQIICMLIITN